MAKPARQVFVISDLHIGGVYPHSDDPQERGFRINPQVPQLTAFVTALADKQPGQPAIELVINGDFVDLGGLKGNVGDQAPARSPAARG